MFRGDLSADLLRHPPSSEDSWVQALGPVKEWVTRIEGRGGRVILFVPAVSGHQREPAGGCIA